jgi:plasmid stabilization system protein ParE
MPRVVWTEEAEEQLTSIPSDETVEELLALAAGLARFPQRGRHVPELEGQPEYEIVREVILPRKARVFYLFVPDSDEVIILGLLCRAVACSARASSAHVSSRAERVYG